MFFFLFLYLLVELFFECVVGKIRGHKKTDKCLQYQDFHICVKNRELIFSAVSFVCFDIPLLSKTAMMLTLGS